MPEFLNPVFAKTSPKRSLSMTENEHFGLVFVYTGSKNLGTVLSFWKIKLPHFGGENLNYPGRVVSLKLADQIFSRPKKSWYRCHWSFYVGFTKCWLQNLHKCLPVPASNRHKIAANCCSRKFLRHYFCIVFCMWPYSRGSQRDVIYLGWPIAPSYMRRNGGEGVLLGLSQWVQLCTWSPN